MQWKGRKMRSFKENFGGNVSGFMDLGQEGEGEMKRGREMCEKLRKNELRGYL